MRDENTIVRERQQAIRREMDRQHIALKAVALDGGWDSTSTILSYFPNPEGAVEPKTMSIAALYRLIDSKALPLELLSLLLPDGVRLVSVPESVDHDELATAMQDWLRCKEQAHHVESELGREIGPTEDNELRQRMTVVRAA